MGWAVTDPCADHLARHGSNLISSPLRKISGRTSSFKCIHAPTSFTPHSRAFAIMAGQKVHINSANGPVTKRQKVQVDGEKSAAPVVRQSKIFAPFRVCLALLSTGLKLTNEMLSDRRPSISHQRSFHLSSTRQNHVPDHHLCRSLAANLRPEARTEPRLHN